jgi:hypothetical protein
MPWQAKLLKQLGAIPFMYAAPWQLLQELNPVLPDGAFLAAAPCTFAAFQPLA